MNISDLRRDLRVDRLQRLSSGVHAEPRPVARPALEPPGRRQDVELALRHTEDALVLVRTAGGQLETANARLRLLDPAAQGRAEGEPPPEPGRPASTPRERMETVLAALGHLQGWLVAAIDDLATVGENDAASRSDVPALDDASGAAGGGR